jgi:hypothetical protein
MLCPKCGTDVGDKLSLCPPCLAAKKKIESDKPPEPVPTRNDNNPADLMPDHLKEGDLDRLLRQVKTPVVLVPVAILVFMLFSLIVYATHPEPTASIAVFTGLFGLFAAISFVYWALLWSEILQANPLISFISLIIPVAVVWIVVAHPEYTKKPYILHLTFGGISFACSIICAAYTGMSPYDHLNLISGH